MGIEEAENMIRDIINMVNVMKEEEVLGTSTKIQAGAAEQIVGKLEELAKLVGEVKQD